MKRSVKGSAECDAGVDYQCGPWVWNMMQTMVVEQGASLSPHCRKANVALREGSPFEYGLPLPYPRVPDVNEGLIRCGGVPVGVRGVDFGSLSDEAGSLWGVRVAWSLAADPIKCVKLPCIASSEL